MCETTGTRPTFPAATRPRRSEVAVRRRGGIAGAAALLFQWHAQWGRGHLCETAKTPKNSGWKVIDMKPMETWLFAATLLLVPAQAWLTGRAIGRRNWRIPFVVLFGCVAAMVPYMARVALQAAIEPQSFAVALQRQVTRTLDNPEAGLFIVTLGVFVTMLGWTATPAIVMTPSPPAPPAAASR